MTYLETLRAELRSAGNKLAEAEVAARYARSLVACAKENADHLAFLVKQEEDRV